MASIEISKQYKKQILEKWAPLLEASSDGLTAITDPNVKFATAVVLETTQRDFIKRGMLTEETPMSTTGVAGAGTGADGTAGVMYGNNGTASNGDFHWPTIVIPMLRRIFPTGMAHELVGVQPLTGPVGFAFALRAMYGANGQVGVGNIDESANEIGMNNLNTAYTGASGDATAMGLTGTAADMWAAYAGSDSYGGGAVNFLGQGQATGDAEYAELDSTYPMAKFNFLKSTVTAKTRKLAARWSLDLAEDVQAMQGINIEEEMVNILQYEIGAEQDRQVVSEIVKAAILGGSVSQWTPVSADGRNQIERIATLLTHLTDKAQTIAIKTRRGSANFCIASPKVTAVLQQLSANRFVGKESANMPSVPASGIGSLTKVGLINDGSQLLIRDTYAGGDYAVMGYKGTHPGDSGIILCPYIPIQLQKVILPGSMSPAIGARTRYGIMNSPWDAKNFYHFVKITGMTSVVQSPIGSRYFTF